MVLKSDRTVKNCPDVVGRVTTPPDLSNWSLSNDSVPTRMWASRYSAETPRLRSASRRTSANFDADDDLPAIRRAECAPCTR